ncbi:ADP-ribosylglycohydrolase family protein [Horticoccus luteus]|uniref:ADP-ribosylglycohydrolase family protein n=1 Tax=Horticoccus luteus TaxID=2862869 RepID=A0A8F9XLB3_9BACT|nr:ADP-ribosylglycohydrolase family protein [Horticoccus luteus]QYM79046.1 ADP-ribosylglycohydrolase family protein [Horticoccus luteus]
MSSTFSPSEWSQFVPWANRELWLYGCDLGTEALQAEQEGRDLSSVAKEFARLAAVEPDAGYLEQLLTGRRGAQWFADAGALLDRVSALPMRPDYPFVEPSDLKGIRAQRRRGGALPPWRGSRAKMADRVRGAFLGRVAGCMLGKPFESADQRSIRRWAEETGNWPLRQYQRSPTPAELRRIMAAKPLRPIRPMMTAFYIDRTDGFPSDDDINYTLIGMEVMRRHGRDFTPVNMATLWCDQLPINATCTAERVAYRNFISGCLPPRSAVVRNPYREWIGAQIRADFFGYAAPGDPAQAAEWAWRDASISHVKNGIYGEMWVAAMLAAAYVVHPWPDIIRAGLAQVPRRSRLQAGVERILVEHAAGADFDTLIASIHAEWNELSAHDWCHTIPNAQVVAASLLCGGEDFTTTIRLAVAAGFDTDCNGATCGSLFGLRGGESAVPAEWLTPLRDRLRTGLQDYADRPLHQTAEDVARAAATLAKK